MKKLLIILIAVLISNQCFAKNALKKTNTLQELLLQIIVNEYDIRKIFYVLKDNNIFYISLANAKLLNLNIPSDNVYKIKNEDYIRLNSVPGIKIDYDQVNLILYIYAKSDSFNLLKNNADNFFRKKVWPEDSGAFLNYDTNLRVDKVNSRTSGEMLGELGVFNSLGFGSLDFIAKYLGNNSQRKNNLTRLNTSWVIDNNLDMSRVEIGDSISSAADWGGVVRFGGIKFSRNFSTQPRFITFPTPLVTGSAAVPTNLDIFVNDTLVRRQEITQGPFEIAGLSTISGQGNMTVVTKDVLGRETRVVVPYYTSQSLLKPGLSDYSFELGVLRHDFSIKNFKYKDVFASGSYKLGINNYWTSGLHFETTKNIKAVGFDNTFNLFNKGEVNNSIAIGKSNSNKYGYLFSLGYLYKSTRISFGTKFTFADRNFTFIGNTTGRKSPSLTSVNFVGYSFKKIGNISLSYTIRNNRSSVNNKFYVANYSKNLSRYVHFSSGFILDRVNSSNNKFFVNFILSFGGNKSIAYSGDSEKHTVRYSKFANTEKSYGYNISSTRGSINRDQADIDLKHNIGELKLKASRTEHSTNYQATALGSIVYIDNKIKFSKRLTSGFALVKIPNGDNVKVLRNNYTVGNIKGGSSLIVPNLLDYNRNNVSIMLEKSPINLLANKFNNKIVPYYRSGKVLEFKTKLVNNISFNIFNKDRVPLPPGTEIEINNQNGNYYVGYDGEVYLQPESGVNILNIKATLANKKVCNAIIDLTDKYADELVIDLGDVICVN